MVQIKNKASITFGIFIALLTIIGTILSNQISLIVIFLLLFSVYLILDSILCHKTGILYILLGFATLVSTFIWMITQKSSLSSFDVIIGIIITIIALILGIGVLSGRLSEKWIRINT